MATVNQLVEAFNKGDTKSLLASCTDEMCIIDEFPPHEWHGAGTCSKWLADYDADAKKNEISDGAVTIGKPLHVDVTADRAYVVVPGLLKKATVAVPEWGEAAASEKAWAWAYIQ